MNRRAFLGGCAVCAMLASSARALAAAALQDGAGDALFADAVPPGHRPDPSSTEAGLWMAVDQMEDTIRNSHLVIADAELAAYLQDLSCRLAHGYCSDIRVYPMRIPHFNASMAPNGMMQVWSGLMLRTSSEAQLSTVLGHEIGHYLRRHSVRNWEQARDLSNFMSFLSLGLAVAGASPGTQDLARLAGYGLIFSYGRDLEREADAMGLHMMHRAGINPWHGVTVWERVVAEQAAARYRAAQDPFFATHPASVERIGNLSRLAQSLGHRREAALAEGPDAGPGAADFWRIVGRHRARWIEDQLNLRHFNQAELILGWLAEDGVTPGEIHFYRGELYRRRGEEGDAARARDAYEAAIRHGAAPPEAHRGLGLAHMRAGDRDAARNAFARYLELKPEADDREMIRSYMGDV